MTRGKKCKVTAYCYVYRAFFKCILETICMVVVFRAAVDLESWEKSDSDATEHKNAQLVASAIAVVVLLAGQKVYEKLDFVQLDQRGRSGTRKDLRNWLVDHYTQIGATTSSYSNIDSGYH